MTARIFVESNVLVYAKDLSEGDKHLQSEGVWPRGLTTHMATVHAAKIRCTLAVAH